VQMSEEESDMEEDDDDDAAATPDATMSGAGSQRC